MNKLRYLSLLLFVVIAFLFQTKFVLAQSCIATIVNNNLVPIDSISICSGNFIVLRDGASPPISLPGTQRIWRDENGVQVASGAITPAIQFTNATDAPLIKKIVLTKKCNTIISRDSIIITVLPRPKTDFIMTKPIVCARVDSVILQSAFPLNTNYEYTWGLYKCNDANANNLSLHGHTSVYKPLSNDTLCVFLFLEDTTNGCQALSGTQQLIVKPTPIPEIFLENNIGCVPITVDFFNFTDTSIFEPPVFYQWEICDSVYNQFIPDPITFTDPAICEVKLTISADGCVDTQKEAIYATTPVLMNINEDTLCPRAEIELSLSLIGDTAEVTDYDWFIPNAQVISKIGKGERVIVQFNEDGLQTIYVTAVSPGCVRTDTFERYIHPLVIPSNIQQDLDSNDLFCIGDTILVAVEPISFTRFEYFLFSQNDTTDSASVYNNVANVFILPQRIEDYPFRYGVIDSTGCIFKEDDVISIIPLPTIDIAASINPACIGDKIVFTTNTNYTFNDTVLNYKFFVNNVLVQDTSLGTFTMDSALGGNFVVKVIYTDGCGNVNEDSIAVNVNPYPFPIFEILQNNIVVDSICANTEICVNNLSADSATHTYTWNFGNGQTSSAFETCQAYTQAGAFDINLSITNSFGCTRDTTLPLTVIGLPSAPIIDETQLEGCYPDTVQFINLTHTTQDTTDLVFTWNYGGGDVFVGYNATEKIFNQITTLPFTLTATNTFGCSDTANFEINIGKIVDLTITTPVDTACPNELIIPFQVAADTGIVNSFTWSTDGTVNVLSETDSISQVSIIWTTGGFKSIIVTANANGCLSSDTAQITIREDVTFTYTFGADSNRACLGESISFTANPSNLVSYTFAGTAPSAAATFTLASLTKDTIITVTAIDTFGCTQIGESVLLSPYPTLNNLTLNVTGLPACVGQNITLTATANTVSNKDTVRYQFNRIDANGNTVVGAVTSNNTFALAAQAGEQVFVMAFSALCNDTVFSDTIAVNIIDTLQNPTPTCINSQGFITVSWNNVASAIYTIDQTPLDNVFVPVNPGNGSHVVPATNGDTLQFILKAETAAPCFYNVISDTLTCPACPVQSFKVHFDSVACTNSNVLVLRITDIQTLIGGNVTFTVREGANTLVAATTATTITVPFTLTQNSINLTVEMTNSLATTCQVIQNISYTRPAPITYNVIPTQLCSGSDITVTALPANYVNYTFLSGNTTLQVGSSNSFTFSNLQIDTTIRVNATDSNGCVISGAIQNLNLLQKPTVTLALNPTDTCLGGGATVVANPLGLSSYQFFANGVVLNGIGNTRTFAINSDSVGVIVIGTNACGASNTSNAIIIRPKKNTLPKPVVSCGTSTFNSVSFTWNNVPNAVIYQRSVSINGGAFSAFVNDSDFSHLLTGLAPGTQVRMIVKAIAGLPCSYESFSDTATCVACPTIGFTLNVPTVLCQGDSVSISVTDLQTLSNAYSLQYQIPGLPIIITKNTSIKVLPTNSGTNNIVVTLVDSLSLQGGCSGTETRNGLMQVISSVLNAPVVTQGSTRDTSTVTFTWNTQVGLQYDVQVFVNGTLNRTDTTTTVPYLVGGLTSNDSVDIIVRAFSTQCSAVSPYDTATWVTCPALKFDLAWAKVACSIGDTLLLNLNNVQTLTGANFNFTVTGATIINATATQVKLLATANTISVTTTLSDNLASDCNIQRTITHTIPNYSVTLNYAPSATICQGNSVNVTVLPAGLAEYRYNNVVQLGNNVFTFNNIQNNITTSSVSVKDTNGCQALGDSIRIQLRTITAVNYTVSDTAACTGQNITFTAQATTNFPSAITYKFYNANTNALLQQGNSATFTTNLGNNNLSVRAVAVDVCGDSVIFNPLTVQNIPTPSFDLTWQKTICQMGDTLWLRVNNIQTNSIGTFGYVITGGTLVSSTDTLVKIVANANIISVNITLTDNIITQCPTQKTISYTIPSYNMTLSYAPDSVVCAGTEVSVSILPEVFDTYTIGSTIQAGNLFAFNNVQNDITLPVSVMDTNGCMFLADSIRIRLKTLTSVQLTASDTAACNGETVTFTAQTVTNDAADVIYQFFQNGFVIQNAALNSITLNINTDSLMVHVVATNSCGTSATSDSVTVRRIAPLTAPTISCGNSDTSNVTFNWNTVAGAADYEVSVSINGGLFSAFTSVGNVTSHTVSNLTFGSTVQIVVRANSGTPCNYTATSNAFTCISCKNIGFDVADTINVCEGTSATLNVTNLDLFTTGTNYSITYQYGTQTTTSQSNSFTFTATNLDSIVVTVRDSALLGTVCNGILSEVVRLNVTPTVLPTPTVICNSSDTSSVTFTWAAVANATSYEIQTIVNGGTPSAPQTITATTFVQSGLNAGTEVKLIIRALSGLPCNVTSNYDTTTCVSNNCPAFDFTANIPTILCEGSIITIGASNLQNVSTGYYLTYSGQLGTTTTKLQIIQYGALIGGNDTLRILLGDSAVLQCPAIEKVFVLNVIPLQALSVLADSACANDTLFVTAQPNGLDSYSITVNTTTTFNTQSITVANPVLTPYNLTIKGTKDGCEFTKDTVLNIVKPVPTGTLSLSVNGQNSNGFACENDTIVLEAQPTGFERYRFYNQTPQGQLVLLKDTTTNTHQFLAVPGNYNFKVSFENNGCISDILGNQFLGVLDKPEAVLNSTITKKSICDTSTYTLNVIPSNLSYQYNINGSVFVGGSSYNGKAFNDTIHASVRVTNSNGCSAFTNRVMLPLAHERVQLKLSLQGRIDPCNFNEQLVVLQTKAQRTVNGITKPDTLSPQTADSMSIFYPGSNYAWNDGRNFPVRTLSSFADTNKTYWVTLNIADGCKFVSDTFTLIKETANFLPNPVENISTCLPAFGKPIQDSLFLTAATSAGFVRWELPSGQRLAGGVQLINYNYIPTSAGEFQVNAIQCNGDSGVCCNTKRFNICVSECLEPYIPDAISPNGDGKNDVWEMGNLTGNIKIELEIFNRWGALVYKNADYQDDWGGTKTTGENLPDGVYLYVIKISGNRICRQEDFKREYRGNILLQR
jgi:gliding motility-associated-like protein